MAIVAVNIKLYKPSKRFDDVSIFDDVICPSWPTLDQASCSNAELSSLVVTNDNGEAVKLSDALLQQSSTSP